MAQKPNVRRLRTHAAAAALAAVVAVAAEVPAQAASLPQGPYDNTGNTPAYSGGLNGGGG
ncbi:MAG TPA: hypothetical protein VE690_07620 [Rhodopila sp.]|nr:hypothetical protein [Rhodopila sp.]